jgi:L-ascorbate metabolism protein UlaG (beta-lactamase superfamily)
MSRRAVVAGFLVGVVALASCGGSGASASHQAPPTTASTKAVATSSSSTTSPPTTSTAPPTAEEAARAAARRAFFGADNVDDRGNVRGDRVILSWFGVSSVAASFAGHVALLDTYINGTDEGHCSGADPNQPPGYVPTTYDQLAALAPEAIFIGHEHSDHLCRTGELLVRTGAVLIGLPQACEKAQAEADSFAGHRTTIRCDTPLAADSVFGTSALTSPFGPDIGVMAMRNLHSGKVSHAANNSGGAEAMLYRFTVGDLSVEWNDSDGPMREHAPALLEALKSLPATDVVIGASLGLGFTEQGFRDAVDYPEAMRASQYYPLHHDYDMPDGRSKILQPLLEREMAGREGLRTQLEWLQDPGDYLRPLVFDPASPAWKN